MYVVRKFVYIYNYIKCCTFIKFKGTSGTVEMIIFAYRQFENIQCTICPLFSTTSCTGTVSEKNFASIFSTSVGTNYLDHSIGVSPKPFVSLFIRKDFGS